MTSPARRAAAAVLPLAVAGGLLALPAPAAAVSTDVVIAEVYGGGGNTGATYRNDFIELANLSGTDVDVDGWSVQYASSSGTTWTNSTPLSGTIPAGGSFLVAQASGGATGEPLPAADVTGTINLSGSSGKVALSTSTAALTCAADCAGTAAVTDFVGYGSANDFEGSAPAAGLTSTTSAARVDGAADTDQNGTDFTAGPPTPESSGVEPEAVRIAQIQGAAHVSPRLDETVQDVPGVVTQRTTNGFWMQDPEPFDADPATSEGIFVFTSSTPPAAAAVGAAVTVDGTVGEFRPGGSTSTNLSTTQIGGSPTVEPVDPEAGLPAATTIGAGGRVPPSDVIDDDATGSVETSGSFDEGSDGIDFSESLEGMRLALDSPDVVGPTNDFGELPVVVDGAEPRTPRGGIVIEPGDFNPERVILDALPGTTMPTADTGDGLAGTVTGVLDYSFGNFKLYVDQAPAVVDGGLTRETAAAAAADELAVATYNVENLDPTDDQEKFDQLAQGIVDGLAAPDVVTLEEVQDNNGAVNDGVTAADVTLDRLVAAIQTAGGPTYEWRQIDPEDDQDGGEPGGNIRVAFLYRADRGLEFVDRPGGDATTPVEVLGSGSTTRLSASPARIEPENRAWVSSRKPLVGEFGWRGRTVFVVANHFASKGGDDPLYGRFQPPTRSSEVQRHRQARVLRGFADDLLAADPDARLVVAGDLNDFQFSQTLDIVDGDGSTALVDLPRTLPVAEQYTYVFDGNSQVLDHLLVSPRLADDGYAFDIVHTNAEFADQVSDHDPQVVRLDVDAPSPTELTIHASRSTVTYRDTVILSGRLTDAEGNGLAGRQIEVQEQPVGAAGPTTIRRVTTDAGGRWATDVTPRSRTDYTAVYRGGEDLASTAPAERVDVRPIVRATPGQDQVDRGQTLRVIGTIAPADASGTVRLQRLVGGSWQQVASAPVGSEGDYVLRWTARPAGQQRLRVVTVFNPRFLAGQSAPFTVVVR